MVWFAACALNCGDDEADGGTSGGMSGTAGTSGAESSGSTGTSSTTGVADSSSESSEGSSSTTGEALDPVCDVEFTTGIVGITNQRTCDTGPAEECVMPRGGVLVAVYEEDPRLERQDFDTVPLDPNVSSIDETMTTFGGSFSFELGAGDYYVCVDGPKEGFCTGPVAVQDGGPLPRLYHETGNGDFWSSRSC